MYTATSVTPTLTYRARECFFAVIGQFKEVTIEFSIRRMRKTIIRIMHNRIHPAHIVQTKEWRANRSRRKATNRNAKWALREFNDETLLGTWDKEMRYGYGKRNYIHFDREDKEKYYFFIAYIPRALNNRDVNEAILRMYFVRRWSVKKRFFVSRANRHHAELRSRFLEKQNGNKSMESIHLIANGVLTYFVQEIGI